VNGTLFFVADDGTNGRELWKSDGTDAGTVMVRDILTPLSAAGTRNALSLTQGIGSNPLELQNVGGTLYFYANDGAHGIEPWRSDGTSAGTFMIKDINYGTNSSLGGRFAIN
jgi:ELWxxDGT repeat protein